ncbi:MAG: glycine-rich domain-containing protein [Gammaproteobacteria bacterium]
MFYFLIFWVVVLIAAVYLAHRANLARRIKYLERFQFPDGIAKKLSCKYPQLTKQQQDLVLQGLRDYFLMCHQAKRKCVSMPSQAIDEAWHAFILTTRLYDNFCRRGFGYFLHHTPAEAMATPTLAKAGIKRAWRLACAREQIDPKRPSKLPFIFALDEMLNIPDGFIYSLQCSRDAAGRDRGVYCAGDIGCASGCAGDSGSDGFAHSDSSSCSSDGCGGGCGGGD